MKSPNIHAVHQLTLIVLLMVCALPFEIAADPRPTFSDIDYIQFDENITPRMKSILITHVGKLKIWAQDKALVNAVKEQNSKKTPLDNIKKIDQEWVDGKVHDFAMSLQTNKAGKILTKSVNRNKVYVEAFLCDDQGAVVGEYPKTTDYWQGDEDKFKKSFNNGKGRIFVGKLEYDESTKTHAVQVSVPVLDNYKTIGVLIVGLRNIK